MWFLTLTNVQILLWNNGLPERIKKNNENGSRLKFIPCMLVYFILISSVYFLIYFLKKKVASCWTKEAFYSIIGDFFWFLGPWVCIFVFLT